MNWLLGVCGDPIAFSRTPQLHRVCLQAAGLEGASVRISTPTLAEALRVGRGIGLAGLNVTSPFKGDLAALDEVDAQAQRIGAVNTITFRDGRTRGSNTDVAGVTAALDEHASGRALILGTGGAARAAICALAGQADVSVWGRDAAKAESLATEFGVRDVREPDPDAFDVVVHTTSATSRLLPEHWWRPGHTLLDACYRVRTETSTDAESAGARVIGGETWLLHQGVASFAQFTGARAEPVRAALADDAPEHRGNLALIGMPGSGKSAIAAQLGWQGSVLDLDAAVEQAAGLSVAEIFEREGEAVFRARELGILSTLGHRRDTLVVCGGGATTTAGARDLLKRHALNVWLWADPKSLSARMSRRPRPVLTTPTPALVRELLAARVDAYAATADLVIATDTQTPAQVAERIRREIRQAW